MDTIVRLVMNFIAPESLGILWENGTNVFISNEELLWKFHFGGGYVRNEGLGQEICCPGNQKN